MHAFIINVDTVFSELVVLYRCTCIILLLLIGSLSFFYKFSNTVYSEKYTSLVKVLVGKNSDLYFENSEKFFCMINEIIHFVWLMINDCAIYVSKS